MRVASSCRLVVSLLSVVNGDGFGDLTIADGIRPVVRICMSRRPEPATGE